MKKYTTTTLVVAIVFAVTLAAWAQRDASRGERRQQRREIQQQAIVKIQEHAAKLKTDMEEAAQARQNRSRGQSLSEEERNARRESWRKRREEQQRTVADLDLQVAILKGSRQLRTEHEEALAEFQAIRDLATEEKAERTVKHLSKLIEKKQESFEETLKTLGFEQ